MSCWLQWNCENFIGFRLTNPCVNGGTCMDLTNNYMCDCLAGFTGRNCTINIDDCTPNPCVNNGTCLNLVNDYPCDCVEGFTGRNCS